MTTNASAQHAAGAHGADARVFAAEITPHRSLGPRGFAVLIGFFALVSTAVSLPFVLMGAWPIAGFFGLDVLLIWLAFRASFAQARACEQVVLTHIELTIAKITHRGLRSEWRFNPLWVRLESETDEDFGMTRLAVRARDASLAVGEALSPHERAEFAEALGRALAVARAGPRHDAAERR